MDNTKATATNIRRIEQMRQCPRFDKCNAAICPLDPDWLECVMHSEDRVCLLMSEAVKEGAEARFKLTAYSDLFKPISEAIPSIIASDGNIRIRLAKASTTQSKLEFSNRHAPGKEAG